ncbi:hypothetical protein MMC25_001772 [Agyrium rufum]|nr:hypothetical protein [Agyrium rufum]
MYFHASVLFTSALIALGACAPLTRNTHSRRQSSEPAANAVYFASNDPAGNEIYALKVASDGTLQDGNTYVTGGAGGSLLVPGSSTELSERDGLSSSHSVIVSGDQLFVVNAGSATISMFNIDPNSPTDLALVGGPVSTQGDFPVSIAVSGSLNQVCVANSGANAGIACFYITAGGLVSVGATIPYELNQTNPPTDTLAGNQNQTRAHYTSVSFNSDSSALYTTVTFAAVPSKIPSEIVYYPVINGQVSATGSSLTMPSPGSAFAAVNLPDTNTALMVHSAYQSIFVGTDPNGGFTSILTNQTVAGSNATCWASYASDTNSVFITDSFVNRFTEVDRNTGALIENYAVNANGKLGMLDSVVFGGWVYAISPSSVGGNTTASVSVLDISGGSGSGRVVQDFTPSGLGVRATIQGIAAHS